MSGLLDGEEILALRCDVGWLSPAFLRFVCDVGAECFQ